MVIVPYKPLCLNEILSSASRFETSFAPDFNMDDFINVELYTSEHDMSVGSAKDEFFDCGIHMDEHVVDVDVDCDISESVQTHPLAGLESEKGDVDVPVFVDNDTDPVAKDVTTQDTTRILKRKQA